MKNSILVRYGEIYLKGNNRSFFEKVLFSNIKNVLDGIKCSLIKNRNRLYIENYEENDQDTIISILKTVFGIHSVSNAFVCETNYDKIKEIALEIAPKSGTFRITVNRADKTLALNSIQIATIIGEYVFENSNLEVDVKNPDNTIFVDIRENGMTYVMCEKIPCLGGLPVGTSGKGMLLLSGGIDSPVAAFLMAKRGLSVSAVHFHSFPYTSEKAKQKVLELAEIFSKYCGNIKINVISLTEIQQEIHKKCPASYMITLVRRFMIRLSNIIAENAKCGVLITGESLGQVASQTIESITVIENVGKIPVLRPLIGMDKTEIIDIAKRIGTFEKSIEPYEDCCTVFIPDRPVIKPTIERAEDYEKELDVEKLIDNALQTREFITIKRK